MTEKVWMLVAVGGVIAIMWVWCRWLDRQPYDGYRDKEI